jgi:chromosome partitioning protein
MCVLVLTTQKGGAGKTTLAASLAVAASRDGQRVHVIDVDPQASLYNWGRRREATDITVERCDPADFKRELTRSRHAGATIAIVDTPGFLGPAVTLALADASLCLMPVKPSILDIEAARPTVEQIRRIGRPFAFVLNQCVPSSQARTLDAATALVRAGTLAPSMVAARSDFLDAMTAGQGVSEVNPKGKAAQEIAFLWQWIKSKIEVSDHGKAAA